MTNDSVDDNDVIEGIIDAHRARHVVVARRVEGANMIMEDGEVPRCDDDVDGDGDLDIGGRVVRTHSVSRTKYGYRTTSVMDFDGWTRVPVRCPRVVPDDIETRGHSVRGKKILV